MIKLLVNDEEVKFTITIFPDGTSQVWKMDRLPITTFGAPNDDIKILWLFENEAELFHVVQLAHLIEAEYGSVGPTLVVPYLPYGRQDKDVANNLSFSLKTFKNVLYNANITRIETFDAHSKSDMVYSTEPTAFHQSLPKYDVIAFPDKGAADRYGSGVFKESTVVYFEKVRNQSTGDIIGLKLLGTTNLENKTILIVDDICDGGMTFIKVAESLKFFSPKQVDLAVSHGLFSKGKDCLYKAGITNVYTTNSLLRNPEGFKVW